MIDWKTVEPDVAPRDLATVLASLSFIDLLAVTAVLSRGALVLFAADAYETIVRYVSVRREESGGLLLGLAVTPGRLGSMFTNPMFTNPIVCVTDAVPSQDYHGTSVSLHMDPSVWTSTMRKRESGLLVVGWFHSHPNLGAFFSEMDRSTQRNFFAHEYSLGYVIDPIRNHHAYFLGPNSEEVACDTVVTYPTRAALPASLRY